MDIDRTRRVLVYGAAGHTGRFVVEELIRRGIAPIAAGRRADALVSLPHLERRVFDLERPAAVEDALGDVGVVVNCAGPFLDTALPLADAAVAVGAHYLDITAEQPVAETLYNSLDARARATGVTVVPAMAFYGGLADLMATTALDGCSPSDDIEATVLIGLDHWWPTAGTRITGERNTAARKVIRCGELVPLASPARTTVWDFAGELGEQPVVELPFSEVITIHRHLPVAGLTSYLNTAPLTELRSGDTPAPSAADATGRSSQRFVVDVVVRQAVELRRITMSGRDIYAVTAPIIGEGAARLLDGRVSGSGALAPGEAFDAADMLAALAAHPAGIRLEHSQLTR